MKTLLIALLCLPLFASAMGNKADKAISPIGKAAPDFVLNNSKGETVSLADFKGKYVVLEWVNRGCPFVVKHYESKNMQGLQKFYTKNDVVWLGICSSAPGKQGHMKTGKEIDAWVKEQGAAMTHYLVDEEGKAGMLYAASTTPNMVVIDKEGLVQYTGAIDSIASLKTDVSKAVNYVSAALDALSAGKKVEVSATRSYGCAVKY